MPQQLTMESGKAYMGLPGVAGDYSQELLVLHGTEWPGSGNRS